MEDEPTVLVSRTPSSHLEIEKSTINGRAYQTGGGRTVDANVIDILITWCTPHPEMAGKLLAEIAAEWKTDQLQAARRLQPAGAVYIEKA